MLLWSKAVCKAVAGTVLGVLSLALYHFQPHYFTDERKIGLCPVHFELIHLCRCRPCIKINIRENQFCQGFFLFPRPLSCETSHVLSVNCTPPTLGTQSRPMQVINFDVFPCEWNLPWAHSRHKVYANITVDKGRARLRSCAVPFCLLSQQILLLSVSWACAMTRKTHNRINLCMMIQT